MIERPLDLCVSRQLSYRMQGTRDISWWHQINQMQRIIDYTHLQNMLSHAIMKLLYVVLWKKKEARFKILCINFIVTLLIYIPHVFIICVHQNLKNRISIYLDLLCGDNSISPIIWNGPLYLPRRKWGWSPHDWRYNPLIGFHMFSLGRDRCRSISGWACGFGIAWH